MFNTSQATPFFFVFLYIYVYLSNFHAHEHRDFYFTFCCNLFFVINKKNLSLSTALGSLLNTQLKKARKMYAQLYASEVSTIYQNVNKNA